MNVLSNTTESQGAEGVSLNALRGQALQRLAGVHERLEAKGVGQAFMRAAKPDFVGDMGFLSSLIFNAIVGGPLAESLAHSLPVEGLTGDFNTSAAVGGLEGLSILRDLEAHRTRSFRMAMYPQGRRKCAMEEGKKMRRKFNLVSANQNKEFSYDVQMELAGMFEIIDMLDRLEKQGVREISLGNGQSAYDVLKQLSDAKRGRGMEKASAPKMRVAM